MNLKDFLHGIRAIFLEISTVWPVVMKSKSLLYNYGNPKVLGTQKLRIYVNAITGG